ncbi:MAG: hypothetical protein ACRDQ9_05110 [Pseudonocardiaceae bacterium]
MLGAIATCLMLLALGLPGVIALRRLTDKLTVLEEWIYGLPLGAVVGSLALLVLAITFGGLSTGLVVTVAAVSLAGALWAWPWSTLTAVFEAVVGRQQVLEFSATTTARHPVPEPSPSVAAVGQLLPRQLWRGQGETTNRLAGAVAVFGPLSTVILILFVFRWVILWMGALVYDRQGLWANQINIWGDWALHLGDVTSFVYGDNFPPQNTRYAGGPLAYHYLTSITSAAEVELGMNPAGALALHSFVFCILLLFGLYAFALRLTKDRDAAGVSTGLFLLGGSLGWLVIASNINNSKDILGTLQEQPWDQGIQNNYGFYWQNMFFALIEPQRGYLYGLPLALLILTLLLVGVETWEWKLFAAAGLIGGTLPFAHTSTLVALALITPFMALLFRTNLRTWVRSWTLFFGIWLLTALPQTYLQQGGQRGETSAIRWQVGWLTQDTHESWLWFWGKNLGWFIPLLGVALASRNLFSEASRRLLWAFMPTFILCNLIVFRPWDWDNTKFFLYWFLAVCILVGMLLTKIWREHRSVAVRTLLAGIVATMISSGLLVNYQQLSGKDHNLLLSTEELRVAEQVRELTPAHATFAVSFQHNHPIPVMAGRRVMMSYTGWLFAFGVQYQERERDVRSIYALAPNTAALLRKYDVDYVVIGPGEEREFKPNVELFRARYPRIISTGNYEIFKVR